MRSAGAGGWETIVIARAGLGGVERQRLDTLSASTRSETRGHALVKRWVGHLCETAVHADSKWVAEVDDVT